MKANFLLPCVYRPIGCCALGWNKILCRSKLGGCRWIFPLICNQGGKQIYPAVLISPRKYGHPSWEYRLSRYLRAKINPAETRGGDQAHPQSAPMDSSRKVGEPCLGKLASANTPRLYKATIWRIHRDNNEVCITLNILLPVQCVNLH